MTCIAVPGPTPSVGPMAQVFPLSHTAEIVSEVRKLRTEVMSQPKVMRLPGAILYDSSVRPISLSDPPFISDDLLVRYLGANMRKTVGKCILVSLPDRQQKKWLSVFRKRYASA